MDQLVARLRAAVGQPPVEGTEAESEHRAYFTAQPEWFDEGRVVETLVESELDPGVMPLTPLLRRTKETREGEIVRLVTTYLPAPGIDIMKEKGFQVWSREQGELVETYFCKSVDSQDLAAPSP